MTRRTRRRRRALFAMLIMGASGIIAGAGTYAAFSSSTGSSGNVFASGTVLIADNDAGSALLSLSNARPGDSSTGCIRITYSGSLDATVRLYATTAGGLASYLTLTITRGSDSAPSFNSCASFTADATNYIGAGAGVIYSGNLSAFPSTYASGLDDPTSGSPATWTTSTSHSYRFTVTLQNDPAAQGLSSSSAVSWEARNT